MNKQRLEDRSILSDALQSQRHLTETYNNFAAEASDEQLRRQVMDIHRQEHDNAYKIFQAMHRKGWYRPEQTDAQQLNQLRTQLGENRP